MKQIHAHIKNEKGKEIDAFEGFDKPLKMHRLAEKRSRGFALELARPHTTHTLQDSLALAYIQGMYDACLVL